MTNCTMHYFLDMLKQHHKKDRSQAAL